MTRQAFCQESASCTAEAGDIVVDERLSRRSFLQYTSGSFALLAFGLLSGDASALPGRDVFSLTSMSAVLERLGGIPTDQDEIGITVPDVAENGASVPVTVASSLNDVQELYVLVESNPYPFAAAFSIPFGTDARISVNLKLAQSSQVIGVVRAANKLFWSSKHVQVAVGGCA